MQRLKPVDSVRDFDLLGESVQKVRVSAHNLALLGFLTWIYSDSLLPSVYIYIYIYILRENTLGECRINILKIERRKRGTTGEKKKWPPKPSRESNPGPLAFRAIALPVKLLGQVPLRPNHGATFSLSSRKNERLPMTHVFIQNPLISLGAQPSGIPSN